MDLQPHEKRPSELFGNYWFNAEPVSLGSQQGNVILVDFWDSVEANSLRGLTYVREWHHRYGPDGLVVIGVHTPQFSFQKNPETMETSLKRLGIDYPVVMDNEGLIWRSYDARVKPTRFLVDKDGFLRVVQEGAVAPERFERAIQALLAEAGIRGEMPEPVEAQSPLDIPGVVCYPATGDVLMGYLHGSAGNPEGYNPESTLDYVDPGVYLPGRFYAQGRWIQERELFRFSGERDQPGSLSVLYEAAEVHAVLHVPGGSTCRVEVHRDQQPLGRETAGEDVVYSERGESYVEVGEPRLYSVVKDKDFGEHVLRLTTAFAGVEVFSLSFVSTVVPEFFPGN
jgi:hypothetical protein